VVVVIVDTNAVGIVVIAAAVAMAI